MPLFIVVWITGGCEDVMSDEFTDSIDTWPEVFNEESGAFEKKWPGWWAENFLRESCL